MTLNTEVREKFGQFCAKYKNAETFRRIIYLPQLNQQLFLQITTALCILIFSTKRQLDLPEWYDGAANKSFSHKHVHNMTEGHICREFGKHFFMYLMRCHLLAKELVIPFPPTLPNIL